MSEDHERMFTAPYSVERGAEIAAQHAKWFLGDPGEPLTREVRYRISSKVYSIVVNMYTGREVSSYSSMGVIPHKDTLLIEKIIIDAAIEDGQDLEFIQTIEKSGKCSELQGVSKLLEDGTEPYRPLEYIVYNYKIGFAKSEGKWQMTVEPVRRCELCWFIEYMMAPTDELDGYIIYYCNYSAHKPPQLDNKPPIFLTWILGNRGPKRKLEC